MDQFPIGYQLSACPLVPMIKLLKRRIIRYTMSCFWGFFSFFLFCKRVFCVFSREFQHKSIKSVQCVPLDFFLSMRPPENLAFLNLFRILLDFGTGLLLFPNCLISECSVFFFCILISEIPPPSLSLRLKYQFFTRPPTTHTHTHTHAFSNPVQYCGFISSSLSTHSPPSCSTSVNESEI